MITKKQLATASEVLATASIVGVGWALGGTMGAGIMVGIGINLGSDIIQKGSTYLKEKWLSREFGVLNHDIQKSLVRAYVKALEKLEPRYFDTPEANNQPHEKRNAIRGLFKELKEVAPTVFVTSLERIAGEENIREYLDAEPQIANERLWERIEGTKLLYTYYGDHFKTFLRDNIADEVVFWFREDLKTDSRESNKAWRAFQRLLLEGIEADLKALQTGQDVIQQDLRKLDVLRSQLDELTHSLEGRTQNEPFQRALENAIGGLALNLDGVATKIDGLAADVKNLLTSKMNVESQGSYAFQYQLPAPPLDFTGREDELNDLRTMVKSGNVSISGLHGMGGIGKTALALMLANEIKDVYPDGQIYLDLKGVSRRVESAIKQEPLSSIEVMTHVIRSWHPEERVPDSETELAARYRTVLADKRALLFFDNARNAAQLTPLIPANRDCLLLVTSRQRFALGGREPYDINKLKTDDAVTLLRLNCSRLSEQDAKTIAEICDCLPMALKPAVSLLSKSRSLTSEQLINKLRDKKQLLGLRDTERKDELADISIEASFQLSYELLADDDLTNLQQRWRSLAVFPDTFDESAVAAVWMLDENAARETLNALDSYSLIELQGAADTRAPRCALHDLARDFADTKLQEEERNLVSKLHAYHFASVLKSINRVYRENSEEQAYSALELFDTEWINIEGAWTWAEKSSSTEAISLRSELCDAGTSILFLRQRSGERIRWLEAALQAARALKLRAAEGRHLCNLGRTYHNYSTERKREPIQYLEAALNIAREVHDRFDEGQALGCLGVVYRDRKLLDSAKEYFDRRLSIAHALGDKHGEASTHGNVGLLLLWEKNYDAALRHFEQQLLMARELKMKHLECQALGNKGQALACLDRVEDAIEFLNRSILLARRIGARRAEAGALGQLGNVSFKYLDNCELARALYEESLRITRDVEFGRAEKGALVNLAKVCLEMGRRNSDRTACNSALEYCKQILPMARNSEDKLSEGLTFWTMAQAYELLGDIPEACEAAKNAEGILRPLEHKVIYRIRKSLTRWSERTRQPTKWSA
jgi:tetratricopeptide (TPR) repeat protein